MSILTPTCAENSNLEPDAVAEGPSEDFHVERHGELFVASRPQVGALSALSLPEVLALHVYYPLRHDSAEARRAVATLCAGMGWDQGQGLGDFVDRMEADGWTRTEPPLLREQPLLEVYFTITRRCNLACPYCYQGLANRYATEMPAERAARYLDKVRAVSPGCQIIVTGGEPFAHNEMFTILGMISERGLPFTILTNGTYIDDSVAARIKEIKGFRYIQLSIDGITEETHAITRGKGHHAKVMSAIESIVRHELPFVLAPTMHTRNLGEIYDIAALAVEHGGWCSPNNLRELPHPGLSFDEVQLKNDDCLSSLREMNERLAERFGWPLMIQLADKYKMPDSCNAQVPNSRFICGMAYSLMDLDWNGDLYPCHLMKDPRLVLGNLDIEELDTIFQRVAERHIRVRSHEIPKCSQCCFVSTCGGGCRAGAWFAYGSLAREDDLCALFYDSSLRKTLLRAEARLGDGLSLAH